MQNASYLQSQTVVRALEFALARGGFGTNGKQKKTAQSLIRNMRSNQSLSGRHEQLATLLRKGATVNQMMKATDASRRTIFRYLNHFEEAGMAIVLDDGKYTLKT